MEKETTLPENWKNVPLFNISELIRGVSYSKKDSNHKLINGFVPILRATNIQNDRLILEDELVFVPNDYVKKEQYLKNGDIVICMSSGSKHLVGKAGQLTKKWEGSFGTFCSVIRPKPNVYEKYLGFYF